MGADHFRRPRQADLALVVQQPQQKIADNNHRDIQLFHRVGGSDHIGQGCIF